MPAPGTRPGPAAAGSPGSPASAALPAVSAAGPAGSGAGAPPSRVITFIPGPGPAAPSPARPPAPPACGAFAAAVPLAVAGDEVDVADVAAAVAPAGVRTMGSEDDTAGRAEVATARPAARWRARSMRSDVSG